MFDISKVAKVAQSTETIFQTAVRVYLVIAGMFYPCHNVLSNVSIPIAAIWQQCTVIHAVIYDAASLLEHGDASDVWLCLG